MKVYKATVIDKCASPSGEEPASYESYIAVCEPTSRAKELLNEVGFKDEDIHYYFTEDEFKPVNGEIETEEFKYLIGESVVL